MKSEINSVLSQSGVDAIVISGASQHNPSLVYFTRGSFFTQADVVLTQNNDPILFYRPMERDNAAKSGMKAYCYDELCETSFLSQAGGDSVKARALELGAILKTAGIKSGKTAFCGRVELGQAYSSIEMFKTLFPDFEVVGNAGDEVIHQLRITKDKDDIAAIRNMGVIVTTIVGRIEKLISSSFLKDDVLVDKDSNPITIGQIKSLIDMWLGEMGAENPEGTIFSLGRDAGVPHNSGDNDQALTAGKSIVYDFFPCEVGGGYFYDFTRTWCIGYAPEAVSKAYEQVKSVHDQLISEIKPNMAFKELQKRTCELFSEMGHPTLMDNPKTRCGYVHSVGHGLGLDIHENPFSGFNPSNNDKLIPGSVFTIEPGLYYPEITDGFGVRIEDTLYMDQNGKAHIVCDYPYQLVIKPQEWHG